MLRDGDQPERRADPPTLTRPWGPCPGELSADSRGAGAIRLEGDRRKLQSPGPFGLFYFIFPEMIFQAGRGLKAELEIAERRSG